MRKALLNIVLPVAAFAMVGIVVAYPTPSDLQTALSGPPAEYTTVAMDLEPTDVRPLIEDYANVIPDLRDALETDADCFVGLDQADPLKLERCAPTVIAAISQVMAYQSDPVVQQALAEPENAPLIRRLEVAATEVCRSIWVSGTSATYGLDSPACQVAQVDLVPADTFK